MLLDLVQRDTSFPVTFSRLLSSLQLFRVSHLADIQEAQENAPVPGQWARRTQSHPPLLGGREGLPERAAGPGLCPARRVRKCSIEASQRAVGTDLEEQQPALRAPERRDHGDDDLHLDRTQSRCPKHWVRNTGYPGRGSHGARGWRVYT